METDETMTEANHQATVVATFDSYRQQALSANQRRRADYYALPQRHRDLLPDYNDLLAKVRLYSIHAHHGGCQTKDSTSVVVGRRETSSQRGIRSEID